MKKIFTIENAKSIALVSLGGYLVVLKIRGLLPYYIRPDYEIFTVSMGIVLLVAGLVTLFSSHSHVHGSVKHKAVSVLLAFVLVIVGLLVPVKSLTSTTAIRRGPNKNLNVGLSTSLDNSSVVSPLLGKVQSESYTVADWTRLFQIDPEKTHYVGKKVMVDGFVTTHTQDRFTISRFVVTCCIVDASPIGIIVDGRSEEVSENEWIKVSGVFFQKEIEGKMTLVIIPAEIEKIPEPKNPYFY